ncbi:MAG: hypothetical protein A2Y62_14505 [Candidatus Fischerbacteria bacterium RBG_13_37_8]|uniref:Thioesterase domain-containing protein n=1 Tax=Candidatus Fischerbacteria bacterium RBG_13_37_8 TaxID=1817863 RepID=A0A1F5VNP5_9BACT|nr:MAG: hypothetical protein A2Y62_14505 [Candidatus Fischerbacteria bacterium RBG_13_37_8]
MRFFLIDRIDSITKNKYARGIKTVTFEECLLASPGFEKGFMPRTLVLEAAAQLASWLIMYSIDFKKIPMLVKMEQVTLTRSVRCGTRLIIEIELVAMNEEGAVVNATVSTDNEIIATGKQCMCTFVELNKLADENHLRAHFNAICRI